MHSLEIIILRNARAAGREQSHLDNDSGDTRCIACNALVTKLHYYRQNKPVCSQACAASTEVYGGLDFAAGYAQGLRDDEIAEGTQ